MVMRDVGLESDDEADDLFFADFHPAPDVSVGRRVEPGRFDQVFAAG